MSRQAKSPVTVAKPRVTPKSDRYFVVSYRGLQGYVFRDERDGRWHAGREGSQDQIFHTMWHAEVALRLLTERMDAVADCRDLTVAVDKAESTGLRTRLAALGGDAAIAAFDAALLKVQADDADGFALVAGMLKVAARKKAPAPVDLIASDYAKRGYRVRVVPGFSVQINDLTYYIGGQAEYGAYNLHYFGEITNITVNTVTVSQDDTGRSAARRMKIGEFAWRNAADVAGKAAQNSETMRYI